MAPGLRLISVPTPLFDSSRSTRHTKSRERQRMVDSRESRGYVLADRAHGSLSCHDDAGPFVMVCRCGNDEGRMSLAVQVWRNTPRLRMGGTVVRLHAHTNDVAPSGKQISGGSTHITPKVWLCYGGSSATMTTAMLLLCCRPMNTDRIHGAVYSGRISTHDNRNKP